MITNIKVSILVPIYGVEKYIERCVRSLLEQTYSNIEFIFVNDSTEDNSMDILSEVITYYPQRKTQIHIINHDTNKGLSGARITAINSCSGDYVCWVDSDDYIEPDMIEILVNRVFETDADIVSCNSIVHYNDYEDQLYNPFCKDASSLVISMLRKEVPVSVWGRIIKRSLYIKNNIAPLLGVNNGEDFQVMPRLVYYATITNVNLSLYHYNCCNINAYTYRFSPRKSDDVWKSILLLDKFFSNKGNVYTDAIKRTEADIVIRDIVNCCRESNISYYNVVKDRMLSIEKRYFLELRFLSIIVYFLRDYYVLKAFVSLVDIFWNKTKRV